MNYFYRQASNLLGQEEVNAKKQVQEVYPWAYRQLLENKAFRKEMRTWLQDEIFPDIQHMKLGSSSSSSPRIVKGPNHQGPVMMCDLDLFPDTRHMKLDSSSSSPPQAVRTPQNNNSNNNNRMACV